MKKMMVPFTAYSFNTDLSRRKYRSCYGFMKLLYSKAVAGGSFQVKHFEKFRLLVLIGRLGKFF